MEKTEFEKVIKEVESEYVFITYIEGSKEAGLIENGKFLSLELVPKVHEDNMSFVGEELDYNEIENIEPL